MQAARYRIFETPDIKCGISFILGVLLEKSKILLNTT